MKLYGFSLKRLVGSTSLKTKIASTIGVPLTQSGRNQKVGKAVIKLLKGK